jgi:glycosyltransferase involved in cell wall biosynthesis
MANPLVSIICDVYNHGPYLRNALEGFVMQQVDFPIEILVHDDASTDNSAEIIREYENKHPDLIRPIYETENQYYKQNLWADIQFPRAQGKYIALCEGDDYWTDPLKLQKQVDYMEAHPECTMCFGNALEHWEGSDRPDKVFSDIKDRDYAPEELTHGWFISTATVLFRRQVIESDLFRQYIADRKIITGDLPLWLTCASMGKVHGLSDIFSVYRRLPSGFMLSMDSKRRLAMGDHRVEIYKVFGEKYKKTTVSMAMTHYRLAYAYARKEKDWKMVIKSLWKSVSTRIKYPDVTVYHLKQILKERRERLSK